MKRLHLILMLFVVTGSVFGQTNVSGNQSGTWDINGSPYYVIGDVTVVTGATLIIEPGVEVLFHENMTIIINGYLSANGNEISQIIFDSRYNNQKWDGIQLIGSVISEFQYCDISNSKNGGINIDNSSNILIDNCSIHDNTSNEGAGLNISNGSSDLTIQYSTINNNSGNIIEEEMVGGGSIVCANSLKILIESNTISNNVSGDFGGGIFLLESSLVRINENEIFENVSRNYNGGGIYVDEGESNWIENNLIHNNLCEDGYGGGISVKTACNIVGNEVYNNTASSGGGIHATAWSVERYFNNNIVHHNIATISAGGILMQGSAKIENCEIFSNEAINLNGGGLLISFGDNYPEINHCVIYDNEALSGYGGGIYATYCNPKLYRTVIRNNKSFDGGAIYLSVVIPYGGQPNGIIDQCVITKNEASIYCGGVYAHTTDYDNTSVIDCYNSIIYDNLAGSGPGYDIRIETFPGQYDMSYIKYNCITLGGFYTNNPALVDIEYTFFDDPDFTNPDDYDYYLLPDSPCIDTGESSWHPNDPDGSPPDIGVIPFHHEEDIKFFHANYNWISFPKLPVDGTQNTNQPVSADNIMDILNTNDPDIDFPLFLELLYEDDDIPALSFINQGWVPYEPVNYDLKSSRGYKLKTEDPENTDIMISGERLIAPEEPNLVNLQWGDNWVGYWLTDSQVLDDAFGEDFDKVKSIKAEDWEWKDMRPERGPFDPVPQYYPIRPLQYGKGYVVKLREPISNFQWQTGNPTIVKDIPKAESFEYAVLPDYESVIIDTIEGGENVVEIGAFVDDVCVGAAVVEEYPVQLLAYTDGVNRSSGFTFQVISGDRGEIQNVGYRILNLETGDFENMSLFPGLFEHNIVKLNIKTLQDPEVPIPNVFNLERNYPNPFNPTTTISFSVAQTTSDVSLEIFNIKGQKVKTLYSGIAEEGKHSILWYGKDTNDKSVSSGIYFYKLKTGKKELTRKMLMLK